jgi:hypothetical protein
MMMRTIFEKHHVDYYLVVEKKEIVFQVDVMLMMDVVLHLEDLVVEHYLMNFVDQDDDDYEHIELFQLLLDEILMYHNHLVVFCDNNLIEKKYIFLEKNDLTNFHNKYHHHLH